MYTQIRDEATGVASTTTVQRDTDGAFIPFDPENRDYEDYLVWCAAGNAPTQYTPPAN